jgi:hypothetical protein
MKHRPRPVPHSCKGCLLGCVLSLSKDVNENLQGERTAEKAPGQLPHLKKSAKKVRENPKTFSPSHLCSRRGRSCSSSSSSFFFFLVIWFLWFVIIFQGSKAGIV